MNTMTRQFGLFAIVFCLLPGSRALAADEGEVSLFNGKDLTGWKLRSGGEEEKGTWKVFSQVALDPADPRKLVGSGPGGTPDSAMLRVFIKHGSDIYTEKTFGDCDLHIEFMVPKGSNSGIYLMGNYEIQVLDSFGRKKLGMGDCGAIYSAAVPKINASKAPGEWQTFDIIFRAPRFGADGKKSQNAEFVSIKLNGQTIHENVQVKGPTGGQLSGEKPAGPLMLQGDHGIVAFRNIRVKPMESR